MPSWYYCRHCDADGHHTTIDTEIWVFRNTVTQCVLGLAGRGAVFTPSSDTRIILVYLDNEFSLSDAADAFKLVEA